MKTYKELSKKQQKAAKEKCLANLLQAVVEGAISFDDKANGDDLQAKINKAGEKANAMQTPWFIGGYIMDTCKEELQGMANSEAEDAIYAEKNENVISGIA